MSEHRHRADWRVAVRRAALTPPGVLSLALVVIWAATGHGYFWPMWAILGIAIPTGLFVSYRWARTQPTASSRRYAAHAGFSAVLAITVIAVWAMGGGGNFWPIYPLIVFAAAVALHRAALRPGERSLQVRVDELTRTRSGALDVQASELRRIERDLHDGAQARLVALSMQLGRAEERLADQPETAALVRRAREEATAAIGELRDLARGIAPPVLADRGLVAAVESLANRSTANVEVDRNARSPAAAGRRDGRLLRGRRGTDQRGQARPRRRRPRHDQPGRRDARGRGRRQRLRRR